MLWSPSGERKPAQAAPSRSVPPSRESLWRDRYGGDTGGTRPTVPPRASSSAAHHRLDPFLSVVQRDLRTCLPHKGRLDRGRNRIADSGPLRDPGTPINIGIALQRFESRFNEIVAEPAYSLDIIWIAPEGRAVYA